MADFSNTIDLWGDGPTLAMILNKTIKTFEDDEVRAVKANAFEGCKDLTEVNLPGCKSVYTAAFSYCTQLASVAFSECSIVGAAAFYGCSNLRTASLPACKSIGYSAFYGCSLLKDIDLPEASQIGWSAFTNCSSLSAANIPKVTHLESNVFLNCKNLRSINIPLVSSIHSSAFNGCAFSRVDLPNCSIPQGFNNCSNLEKVTFGSQPMVTAGYNAFYNCSNLFDIEVDSLRYLSEFAFYGCRRMAERINNEFSYILSIGSYALANTGMSTRVYFPRATSVFSHFAAGNSMSAAILPMCSYVGPGAFYGESSLVSASLPACTSLGGSAFYGCSSLESISLSLITTLPEYAFYGCTSLQSAYVPNISTIYQYAYARTNFSSLSFAKVSSISEGVFYGCSYLTSISLPRLTTMGGSTFYGCETLRELCLPSSLSRATLAYNFKNCYNLSKLEFLNSSTSFISYYSYGRYYYNDPFDNTPLKRGWGDILVPPEAVDYYKGISFFSSLQDNIIKSNHIPRVCQNLTITHVYPAIGNQTKTRVSYEAECTYTINGIIQQGTEIFSGEGWSDPFNSNVRSESMTREITFTYLGVVATATMTHLAPLAAPIEISLTEGGLPWYQAEEGDPTLDDYTMFKSPKEKDIYTPNAIMKITFNHDINEYTILLRSDTVLTGYDSYTPLRLTNVNSENFDSPYSTLSYAERTPGREEIIHYKKVIYRNLKAGDYINIRAKSSNSNSDARYYIALPKYYN